MMRALVPSLLFASVALAAAVPRSTTNAGTSPSPSSPPAAEYRDVVVRVEIPPLSLATYVRLADTIVRGRVLFQMPVETDAYELPYTAIDLEVIEALKGDPGPRLTLHVAGAKTEHVDVRVPAAPRFHAGEEVLLFLSADTDRHGWPYYGVLGLRRGTYRLVELPGGETGVQSDSRAPEPLARFERTIADLLAADGEAGR